MGYYALADNLTKVAGKLLWMTTGSFLRTLAAKRKSTISKVAKSMKCGPNRYVITLEKAKGEIREHVLVSSTKHLKRIQVSHGNVDQIPTTWHFRAQTELGQRLSANECEWCGDQDGPFEVHHVRKLKDLKGKAVWERQMIQRRRKTMVLCHKCHKELHAGRLSEATRAEGKLESRMR